MRYCILACLLACKVAAPPPAAAPYAPRPVPQEAQKVRFSIGDPAMEPATDETFCGDFGQLKVGPTIQTRLRGLLEDRVKQAGAQITGAKDATVSVTPRATPRSKTGFSYCTPASTTQVGMQAADGSSLGSFVVDIPVHDANIGDDAQVLSHVAMIADQAANQPTTMLVLDLLRAGNIPTHVPGLLTNLLLSELEKVKNLKTVSSQDIASMLDVEKKKYLIGCNTTSCMAEIGGALGAQLGLYGQLGQLGSRFNINITVVNSRTARVVGRVSILVEAKEDAIADQTPELARQVVAKLNSD